MLVGKTVSEMGVAVGALGREDINHAIQRLAGRWRVILFLPTLTFHDSCETLLPAPFIIAL